MSYNNYFSVLDEDYVSEQDSKNNLIDLYNEVFGCEDIIFEIISNSPWLLQLSLINKIWNKISKMVIRMASKLGFVELCRQNHYLTIRHLLINYDAVKAKLYKYDKYTINYFTDNTIIRYKNNEFDADDFESFLSYNRDTHDYEFDQSKKDKLDYMINALVSYNDGLYEKLLLYDKNLLNSINHFRNLITGGLNKMLRNTNNKYTNCMIELFNHCGNVRSYDVIRTSLKESNYEVYKYWVNKYPSSFIHTMTELVFYTANINIIKFYLNIRNTTDITIKNKYYVHSPMNEVEWKDALYCSLYIDYYDGVKIALKHTTDNNSGVSCDIIKIKDSRIKELVKDIRCSVCDLSMRVHFT